MIFTSKDRPRTQQSASPKVVLTERLNFVTIADKFIVSDLNQVELNNELSFPTFYSDALH